MRAVKGIVRMRPAEAESALTTSPTKNSPVMYLKAVFSPELYKYTRSPNSEPA